LPETGARSRYLITIYFLYNKTSSLNKKTKLKQFNNN